VAWIALGVSICAALFTGISALVNWWNRADKKRVSLVLVGSLVEVFSRSSPRTRTEELWTLHNAGEGSILTPTARVEGPFGETYSLAGSGALNGHGRLVMKAARDAPDQAPHWLYRFGQDGEREQFVCTCAIGRDHGIDEPLPAETTDHSPADRPPS